MTRKSWRDKQDDDDPPSTASEESTDSTAEISSDRRKLAARESDEDGQSDETDSDESSTSDSGDEHLVLKKRHHQKDEQKHQTKSPKWEAIGIVVLLLGLTAAGIVVAISYQETTSKGTGTSSTSIGSTAFDLSPLPTLTATSTTTVRATTSLTIAATTYSDPFPTTIPSSSQTPDPGSTLTIVNSTSSTQSTAPTATEESTASSDTSSYSLDEATSSSGTRVWPAVALDELKTLAPSQLVSVWSDVHSAAEKYTLQAQLLVAVAMVESSGCSDPTCYASGNGGGCWQFTDADTWAEYGNGGNRLIDSDECEPAAHYISDSIASSGDLYDGLRAYNGPIDQGGDPDYQKNVQAYMLGQNYG